MMRDIQHRACAVFGIPPGLLFGTSDGTADRESYRRFLLTTLQPMAVRMLPDLRSKLDSLDLSISFDTLRGSDLQGLGRGVRSLIDSGLSQEQALRLAGVEAD